MILTICRSKIDNQVLAPVTSALQMRKGFLQNANAFYTVIYLFFASSGLGWIFTAFGFSVPAHTFCVYRGMQARVFAKVNLRFSLISVL